MPYFEDEEEKRKQTPAEIFMVEYKLNLCHVLVTRPRINLACQALGAQSNPGHLLLGDFFSDLVDVLTLKCGSSPDADQNIQQRAIGVHIVWGEMSSGTNGARRVATLLSM